MSIIEPKTSDLLKHADTRYTLAVEAAKRGRQLVAGATPLMETNTRNRLSIAVEEIDHGLVTYDKPVEEEEL